ncbi:MAG: hypothetical protein WAT39_11605, partial [Planctomycetota bacterium]
MSRSPSSAVFLFVFAGAAACGGGAVAEFGPGKTLRKEQRPTVWDASAQDRLRLPTMGPATGGGDEDAGKQWIGETPAGWETAPPARFRDAVWKLSGQPEADCYLTAGVGGGVAFNLTRWYTQQFGIAQVPALEALPVVDLAGRAGRLAEITGTFNGKPDQAALIAFFADGDQVTSLKFTGPAAVVAGNKEKFFALAKSLRSASRSRDPNAPPIQPGQAMPNDATHGGVPAPANNPAPAAAPFTA